MAGALATSARDTVTPLCCSPATWVSTGEANHPASAPTETTVARMKAIGASSDNAGRLTRDAGAGDFTALGVERPPLRRRAVFRRAEIFFSESFRNLRSADSR
jgi:hypothetical protein